MSITAEYVWDWLGDRGTFFCNKRGKDKDVFDTSVETMIKCCSFLKIDDKDNTLYIGLNRKMSKLYMHDPMEHLGDIDSDEIMSIRIEEILDVIEIIDTHVESSLSGLDLRTLLPS